MNSRQLKYILTIAEEGTITSAAQKLYISQPSLSYMLAHVEEELGTKIFDRNVSPLALTCAGEYYVEAAKKMLSIHRDLQTQMDDIKDYRKGRLLIGCGPQLSSIMFPAVLPIFMKEYPGVQIILFEKPSSVLQEMLMSGNLDLAFAALKFDGEVFGCHPLYDEELLVVTPLSLAPDTVIKKADRAFPVIDISQLEKQPLVLFKPGRLLRTVTDRIFASFGVQPNVILETDNWETCYRMAEEGIASTLLPYSPLIRKAWSSKINSYSIDGDYSRHVSIYYRKSSYHSQLMEKFINLTQLTIDRLKAYQLA